MGSIYVLIGPSNSGKDTIFGVLRKKLPNFKTIILGTTRPIRESEVDGIDYYFVDDDKVNALESMGDILEKRVYQTVFGPWTYFTSKSSIDLNNYSYLTVNTLEGYKSLKDYYGEAVKPLYIYVEPGERLSRAIKREKRERNPKYDELCRRFIADEIDFSREKLDALGIYNYYENNNLDECVDRILHYIESDYSLKRK